MLFIMLAIIIGIIGFIAVKVSEGLFEGFCTLYVIGIVIRVVSVLMMFWFVMHAITVLIGA